MSISESKPVLKEQMKETLRNFAKAVAVIACNDGGMRYAIVATAVSEVCLEPPTMLVCINRNSTLNAPLTKGLPFSINFLSRNQEHICQQVYSQALEDRFSLGNWIDSTFGPPALQDGLASFVCCNIDHRAVGTHNVYFGLVEAIKAQSEAAPLLYADGSFGAFAA